MNGAVWAGDGEVTLMSGATLTSIPFVPEPSTVSLIVCAIGAVAAARTLRRRNA
jgi:hypothetical protein